MEKDEDSVISLLSCANKVGPVEGWPQTLQLALKSVHAKTHRRLLGTQTHQEAGEAIQAPFHVVDSVDSMDLIDAIGLRQCDIVAQHQKVNEKFTALDQEQEKLVATTYESTQLLWSRAAAERRQKRP